MKAITTTLYVCGSLMVAATIVGAMDYKSARHKGLFDKLYKEEEPVNGVALKEKDIDVEDYSRGEINRPPALDAIPVVKKSDVKKETVKVAKPLAKKKRKINYKNFSRAAIVEDVIRIDTIAKRQ